MERTDEKVVRNVLLKGIMKGGISRSFYFLMTLLRVKSKYYHLVGSDWVSGISMMEYARNNFNKVFTLELLKNMIIDIKKRTSRYIKKGIFNIKLDSSLNDTVKIILHLNGNLKGRIYNFLQTNIKNILDKTNIYLVIYIDGTFKNSEGIKRFICSLKDYKDKVKIQINSTLFSILDLDFSNFNINLM
jgi:hypothetical protein